jgi:hypothetical protein
VNSNLSKKNSYDVLLLTFETLDSISQQISASQLLWITKSEI